MKDDSEAVVKDGPLAGLQWILLHVEVMGIVIVLLGAYVVQFGYEEYPCPLCLLQRMAMMLSALGPAAMLAAIHGKGRHDQSLMSFAYGSAVIGAILGMCISSRQVLLHILPGDPGYGSAVMGMHLYTWADVVFLVVIAVSGFTMLFAPALQVAKRSGPRPIVSKLVLGAFLLVIAANVVTTFVESGFNLFIPDNPTSYELIDGKDDSAN